MPRLRQVSHSETQDETIIRTYDRLFGNRYPLAQPGTVTGTTGNWWTVFTLVPEVFQHAVSRFTLYAGESRLLDPTLRELGQTRAGWLSGSHFVYSQHCKSCRKLGMTQEKIDTISSWGT
ncbi:MAG TPA: carboxymuconolactone decarboxylase family protein [Acidimicrobiales bacterium]|nr:carboxymuconolactone decarboxylase family protein [Acidimicrobiales bacterium]